MGGNGLENPKKKKKTNIEGSKHTEEVVVEVE